MQLGSQVVSAPDYHPFGWEMPGRKYNSAEYRYGFNGKEKDDEGEFGSITNYDYGFRIYNPAIGKFLSVDPLTKGYPDLTPYQFAANSPISGDDIDGAEFRLKIFSPEISAKLAKAIESGNIIEQRRLTYAAVMELFPDTWASMISDSPTAKRTNNAGQFEFSPLHPRGLTVQLYTFRDENNQITNDSKEAKSIKVSREIVFGYNNSYGPIDKYFPVDINMINGDKQFDGGEEFYGNNDLQGKFLESGGGVGLGAYKGVVSARIKGFGYLEFSYKSNSVGKAGVDLLNGGTIVGSYSGQGATPDNPFGLLGDFLGYGLGNMGGDWESFDSGGNVTWTGTSAGMGIGFSFIKKLNQPIDIPNLLSTSFTKLLSEFNESEKQKDTVESDSDEPELKN